MTYSRMKLLPVFFLPYYRVYYHLIEEMFLTNAFYLLNGECLSVVVHIAVILQSQSEVFEVSKFYIWPQIAFYMQLN